VRHGEPPAACSALIAVLLRWRSGCDLCQIWSRVTGLADQVQNQAEGGGGKRSARRQADRRQLAIDIVIEFPKGASFRFS